MNSQISPADQTSDLIRSVFSFFDRPAYWLLTIIYQLFFNVASADLFGNQTIMDFFGRVQLIIGVYMMFQLAMTILKGIVNPDSFMDAKSGGANLIYRIAVSLIMLTLLVPFRTGGSNQLEKQISNNGILFGTLFDLQHRLLENNTIGRLVLGGSTRNSFFSDDDTVAKTEEEKLAKAARSFSSTILKGFYRINLLPEDQWPTTHNYDKDDPAIFNDVRVCPTIDDLALQTYIKQDVDPGDIIDMVKLTCKADPKINPRNTLNPGDSFYVFAYTGLISMIVGFGFAAILLSFTIDVAVRGVKLAVLRLLAPIPIISYMDPKGGKDGAFNSWVKTLTSTYIDLFIRLAVVYFVIFLIQDMIEKGVVIQHGIGTIGIISWIILWVGLFVFAKQAPAFIKSVLGIKSDTKFGLFSGIGEALGVGAVAAGAIGGAVTNFRAASKEGQQLYGDSLPANVFRAFRTAGSTAAGAVGGLYTGGKAFSEKDGNLKKVLDAQSARNAARRGHQTLPGKFLDSAYGLVSGESLASSGNRVLENTSKASELIAKLKATTEEEGIKNGAAVNYRMNGTDIEFDGERWDNAWKSSNDDEFVYRDSHGDHIFRKSEISQISVEGGRKAQVKAWMQPGGATKTGGKSYRQMSTGTEKLASMITNVQSAVQGSTTEVIRTFDVTDLDTYGATIGAANTYVSDTNAGRGRGGMSQTIRNANNQQKK